MTPKIKKLIDQYTSAERLLINELNELENAGEECECMEPEIIYVVDTGDTFIDSVQLTRRCAKCGGYRETD